MAHTIDEMAGRPVATGLCGDGPDPMIPRPHIIRRAQRETHDTFTIELEPADGEARMEYLPGQFNMLYVFGVGEVPISISGDPVDRRRLVHTTRAVGSVTRAMERLKRGDVVGVRGPYGSAWPVDAAMGNDVIIIAGGIGLAPLRPTIYRILAEREKYGRVSLLYGTRSPADLLYRREVEGWRARLDMDIFVTVDRARDDWRGDVGVVTTLIPRLAFDPFHATTMICGPEIMMRYSMIELRKRGLREDQIFLSMERNMKCAIGICGHCQYGPNFICKDGPVFAYPSIKRLLSLREV